MLCYYIIAQKYSILEYAVLEYTFVKKKIMEKSIHQKRYHTLIALLRAKREAAGVTQTQLSKKLGVNQTVVSKIETCERRIDVIELMDLCNAINISFMEFIDELNIKLR
jgi:ribosome-binding protein aMBF1 (putative translation factor)